jgi:hypothetical protein
MSEKIPPGSSWLLPPTPWQRQAISRLASSLGYHSPVENKPTTRWEARNMIMGFRNELKVRNKK